MKTLLRSIPALILITSSSVCLCGAARCLRNDCANQGSTTTERSALISSSRLPQHGVQRAKAAICEGSLLPSAWACIYDQSGPSISQLRPGGYIVASSNAGWQSTNV